MVAVRWSAKYFFALNSPIYWKRCGREAEEDGERQLLSVMPFKQMQQGV